MNFSFDERSLDQTTLLSIVEGLNSIYNGSLGNRSRIIWVPSFVLRWVGSRQRFYSLGLNIARNVSEHVEFGNGAIRRHAFTSSRNHFLFGRFFNLIISMDEITLIVEDAFIGCPKQCVIFIETVMSSCLFKNTWMLLHFIFVFNDVFWNFSCLNILTFGLNK